MVNVQVRWTTFDLDGRPPKGYLIFKPEGSSIADRVPLINGSLAVMLPTGVYAVTEAVPGHNRTYTLDVPASAAGTGLDLDQYETPPPGTAMTIISRQEFNDLVQDVAGLALTTRPYEPVYVRTEAAATWTINHSLGRYPDVTVLDDAGNEVWADIAYGSLSQVTISFGLPQTGKAVLT